MKKFALTLVMGLFPLPALACGCLPFMFSTTEDFRFCAEGDPTSETCKIVTYASLVTAAGSGNTTTQGERLLKEYDICHRSQFNLSGEDLRGDPLQISNPNTEAEQWTTVEGDNKPVGATHFTARACIATEAVWDVQDGFFTVTVRRVQVPSATAGFSAQGVEAEYQRVSKVGHYEEDLIRTELNEVESVFCPRGASDCLD